MTVTAKGKNLSSTIRASLICRSFVEFETAADLKTAVEKLDNQDFKGSNVRCTADVCHPCMPLSYPSPLTCTQTQAEIPRNDRYRSRSPPSRRGGYSPAHGGYYNRREPPPPRDYSPRRDSGYRRRSPHPRHDYYERDHGRSYRSPPPRGDARGPPISDPYPVPRDYERGDSYPTSLSRDRYDDAPYPASGYQRRVRSPPRGYPYVERPRYW